MKEEKYKEIEDLKRSFMDTALIFGSVLGVFAFIPSFLNAVRSGFTFYHFVDLIILCLFLSIYLFRNKINLRIKTILIIIGLFLLFTFDFIRLGIFSDNKVLLIIILFIVFLIFKMRYTVLMFILITLSFIVSAYFHISGILGKSIDQSARAIGIDTWIVNFLLITIVAFAIIFMIKEFNKQFYKLIDRLEIKNKHILEKESNYTEIFNSTTNAIFIHDLSGNILDVNDTMLEMFKYKRNEISTLNIDDVSSGEAPYDLSHSRERVNEAVNKGQVSFEWQSKDKYGRIFWAEVTLKKAQIAGNERVLAIVNDIDEKKNTEFELEQHKSNLGRLVKTRTEALNILNQKLKSNNKALIILNEDVKAGKKKIEENERRLNSIIQNQGEGFSINDLEENFILATPMAHEIFGVKDGELIGKNLRGFFDDTEWNKIINQTKNRKQKIRSSYELKFTTKDGNKKYLIVTGTPDYNEYGEVIGTLANFRDITERVEKEKKLIELNEELVSSNEELNEANEELLILNKNIDHQKNIIEEKEKRLNTIIHNQGEGLGITDLNETFLFATSTTHEIFGIPDGKLIGRNLKEFILGKDWDEILRQTQKRKKNIRSSYEVKLTLKSGAHKHIILTGSPDYDENGNVIGTIANFRDITERIDREEKMKDLNEELKIQKKELQETLDKLKDTQKQLVQSEKMASLGILAAGVAHEINNPLNYIMGGITGLERVCEDRFKTDSENVLPLVNAIKEGVNRASAIVTGLNHFSRQADSDKEDCNIHSVIDNCLTILQNQLKFRIEIQKKYNQKPIFIKGNEGKLHQAFLNILTNAEQSIENEGIIIITSKTNKTHAIFSVEDNGCGIKEEHLSRISDPFFTTKDPGKGTGLGLSIVHRIIEEHDGTIDFISKEKKGTTVIIKLPLKNE